MKKYKWLENTVIAGLLVSACCALWGSAFPFVKIGYRELGITPDAIYSQILFAGMRFALAGVFTIIIGSILSRKVLFPARKSWPKIINLSLFQTILQYVFFYIGLSHTTGVKASIVQGMNVFVSFLAAGIIFRQEKLSRNKWIGCFIGFLGVILVNLKPGGLSMDIRANGEGFIFLSAIAAALSSVLLKYYSEKEDIILFTGFQFLFGGVVMMIIGVMAGGRVEHYTIHAVGAVIYLALVSAVAYSLWAVLLKYNPVSKVAVYGFMTPVFGVLLSALLLHEKQMLGYRTIVSLILVSAGIYLVNYRKQT